MASRRLDRDEVNVVVLRSGGCHGRENPVDYSSLAHLVNLTSALNAGFNLQTVGNGMYRPNDRGWVKVKNPNYSTVDVRYGGCGSRPRLEEAGSASTAE